jgi:hypothetical protein
MNSKFIKHVELFIEIKYLKNESDLIKNFTILIDSIEHF